MMKTFRGQLFLWMALFILGTCVFAFFFYSLYFEPNYLNTRAETLQKISYEAYQKYIHGDEDLESFLEKSASDTGAAIRIASRTINAGNGMQMGHMMAWGRQGELDNDLPGAGVQKKYRITYGPLKTEAIRVITGLDESSVLIADIPLQAIEESLSAVKRFMGALLMVALPLALLFVYLLARTLAQPITALKDVTESMAMLKFEKQAALSGPQELKSLTLSVNQMAQILESKMNELQETNIALENEYKREKTLHEMKTVFISHASHELRTPITLIQGYVEALKEPYAQKSKVFNDYLDIIVSETDHMERLIKDLFDLSRMETGHLELEMSEWELNSLVDQICQRWMGTFQNTGAQLNVELASELQKVYADPNRIKQVVNNLIRNALVHGKGEATVKILAPGIVQCITHGIALETEDIDKLWEPFVKREHHKEGTGLGLSIVKGILEKHGAEYGVFNSSEGVVFYFKLHLLKEEMPFVEPRA